MLFCSQWLQAQINPATHWADKSRKAVLFPISITGQVPAGDLADRFGLSQSAGFGVMRKTFNGWMYGIEGEYIFGKNVTADSLYLKGVFNTLGFVTGNSGNPAEIVFFQRGYSMFFKVGKIIPASFSNKNSGFLVQAGIGFLQHKISIVDRQGDVPQLQGEYAKGYDRLTNGLAFKQFFGYQHLDKRRFKNFLLGFEFTQGITKGRRSWNFDERIPGTESRLDLLFALKIAWILPVYSDADPSEYFFD